MTSDKIRGYLLSRRVLHPWAWWIWALGIAGTVSLTGNPYVLALALACLCYVVAARRGSAPWARAFPVYLVMCIGIVVYRVIMHVLVGAKVGELEIFTIPTFELPDWVAGITLFGTVYAEGVIMAIIQGLILGTMIVAVGAANALADPRKLAKSLPGALGEVSTAIVIGISIAPQIAQSAVRIYRARRLRGDDTSGVRSFSRSLMPIFQDTLDSSLALAASMDSRGFGRRADTSRVDQRITSITGALGIICITLGVFVILDATVPAPIAVSVLTAGVVFLIISLFLASRRTTSTVYEQLPWQAGEWIVSLCGLTPLAAAIITRKIDPATMTVSWIPLHIPDQVPLLVISGLLVATAPGFLTPRLPKPDTLRTHRRSPRSMCTAFPTPPSAYERSASQHPGVPITMTSSASTPVPDITPWSSSPVLEMTHVSAQYHTDEAEPSKPQLNDVNLTFEEGEILLVIGRTGAGKSTLLNAMTGAMPHSTGGRLDGHVKVMGRDTRDFPPRMLSDVVGVVGQNPSASFVTNTVEEELAYGMEQLGLPQNVMRKRVEETLDLLGIGELRNVPLSELSGGEQQRVAIGAVLTTRPALIVLDEPTSALDPNGAEDVLATITKLAHDLAMTVVLAEHRIERVLGYVDRIAHVNADGTVEVGSPEEVMTHADVAPPLVELGRFAGFDPLPLSIRDARRASRSMRELLYRRGVVLSKLPSIDDGSRTVLSATDITVDFPGIRAVDGVNLELKSGEITTLMGRNGCGKSTLLWTLQGSGKRTLGSISVRAGDKWVDPAELNAAQRRSHISMVSQNPTDILYESTVGAELRRSDHDAAASDGTTRAILDSLAPGIPDTIHPRDLSEGQKLSLALSIQLAAKPPVVLFDEPTRGLDYNGKKALADAFTQLSFDGHAVLVVTHDVEFAALCADRVLFMAAGQIVADGDAHELLAASPAYAPQVAKITAGITQPSHWLTVDAVRLALGESACGGSQR